MPDPNGQFAIIPVPDPGMTMTREQIIADATMVGPFSAVAEPVLSSLAREATEQLLNDTANAIEEEHRLTAQRQRAEQQAQSAALQSLCDGISRMAKRLDAHEKRCAEAARKARADARKAIEASLPDPDDPDAPAFPTVGAGPGDSANTPGVTPGLPPEHEPGSGPSDYSEDDIDTPTGKPPLSYGNVPTSYVGARSEGVGNLPDDPPELGDHPAYNPAKLAHPQPEPPTPSAIGGP
jgi:hypothetical protein